MPTRPVRLPDLVVTSPTYQYAPPSQTVRVGALVLVNRRISAITSTGGYLQCSCAQRPPRIPIENAFFGHWVDL
jgi:hypothetical protein